MPIVIWKNGREGEVERLVRGFCSAPDLDVTPYACDSAFLELRLPCRDAHQDRPCRLLAELAGMADQVVSVLGLGSEDSVVVPGGLSGTTAVRLGEIGGFVRQVTSAGSGLPLLVGVAIDVTLNHGAGYWARGEEHASIAIPGHVLMYHELIGHALPICRGTLRTSDPEAQAIEEENLLRRALGLPQRTGHEGGRIIDSHGGGFCRRRGVLAEFRFPRFNGWYYRCADGRIHRSRTPVPS